MIERRSRHEILPRVLKAQQLGEGGQSLQCFTWNITAARQPLPSLGLVHYAARFRLWTRMAARAAGVMPRIREAAPRVEGRALERRSTISVERPAIDRKSRS